MRNILEIIDEKQAKELAQTTQACLNGEMKMYTSEESDEMLLAKRNKTHGKSLRNTNFRESSRSSR